MSISAIGGSDCGSIDVIWDRIDEGPSGGFVLLGVYWPIKDPPSMNSSMVAASKMVQYYR